MTRAEFKRATGRDPVDDDLDRTNCDKAGHLGHRFCGICRHHLPVFACVECMERVVAHGERVAT